MLNNWLQRFSHRIKVQNLARRRLLTGRKGETRILASDLSRLPESLESRLMLTTHYFESFEAGLGSEWSVQVTDDARVEIRDLAAEGVITNAVSLQFTSGGNDSALTFDSNLPDSNSGRDLGIAILSVDLTGLSDGLLTFHQYEEDDENDTLPDVHSTDAAGDGVSNSRDGTTWYRLLNVQGVDINRGGDDLWQLHEYDLDSEIARINAAHGAGLAFDSNLRFKFSHYDDRSFLSGSRDGWAIDDLRIVDQSDTFDASRPRGVFHRFNLPGEDDGDIYYRAAVFGNPDKTRPSLSPSTGRVVTPITQGILEPGTGSSRTRRMGSIL